jgi:hypothetical protein
MKIEQFNEVIKLIDSGLSLRKACETLGCYRRDFHKLVNNSKELNDQYTHAREGRSELLFEQILEIANHTEEDHTPFTGSNVIQRDRLRVDSIKWVLSKMAPHKYGDKIDVVSDGQKIESISVQIIRPKESE